MDIKKFIKKNWKLILAILYVLSPIDFIPDAILPIGFGDDILVLMGMLVWQYLKFKKEEKQLKFDFKQNQEIREGEIVEGKEEKHE